MSFGIEVTGRMPVPLCGGVNAGVAERGEAWEGEG
jgi:hypothetical protein